MPKSQSESEAEEKNPWPWRKSTPAFHTVASHRAGVSFNEGGSNHSGHPKWTYSFVAHSSCSDLDTVASFHNLRTEHVLVGQ